jgi:hypothetical protein
MAVHQNTPTRINYPAYNSLGKGFVLGGFTAAKGFLFLGVVVVVFFSAKNILLCDTKQPAISHINSRLLILVEPMLLKSNCLRRDNIYYSHE